MIAARASLFEAPFLLLHPIPLSVGGMGCC